MSLKEVFQRIKLFNVVSLQKPPCFLCLDRSFHGKTTGIDRKLQQQPQEHIETLSGIVFHRDSAVMHVPVRR
jgi:hypothetical protein